MQSFGRVSLLLGEHDPRIAYALTRLLLQPAESRDQGLAFGRPIQRVSASRTHGNRQKFKGLSNNQTVASVTIFNVTMSNVTKGAA
jgi:hypothetical protein